MQILEENKTEQSKVCQNSDYIKKDITLLYKKLDLLSNPDKISETKEIAEVSTKIDQDIVKIKKLVEEVKTLVLS